MAITLGSIQEPDEDPIAKDTRYFGQRAWRNQGDQETSSLLANIHGTERCYAGFGGQGEEFIVLSS